MAAQIANVMAARRQPSTTSLSKFERPPSPTQQERTLDFCNAFWGIADGGVDVLFTRMRGATRTVEELRNFWKERAALEEDYAKRLAKLSKNVLGRDEIGDLRISLDIVKLETERQASYHATLAHQLRNELEIPTAAFYNRQLSHKKTQQLAIEKEFKTKQAQEAHVNKAREKYESDGMRINAYTAQSSLVQGKELDKITSKLERAQQTVQVNEREFANFTKILADTTKKWELSWKAFCDNCQDLEEQRIEFMKDNIWTYANAVSTVCVSDDESCEKIRLSLEQMEPEREMMHFVSNYGTGNEIPDPPAFVNYNSPDAVPASSQRTTTRPARFVRVSTREIPPRSPTPEPEPDGLPVNSAGIGAGAGGGSRNSEIPIEANRERQETRRNTVSIPNISTHTQNQPYTNGISAISPASGPTPSPHSAIAPQRQSILSKPNSGPISAQDPNAETIDPTAETYIKVGNHAYKVDLSNDPQQQQALGGSSANRTSSPVKQNGTIDPLQQQLQQLQNAVSTTGSARRNTMHKPPTQGEPPRSASQQNTRPMSMGVKSLSPPGAPPVQTNRSPSPNRDYINSAEQVVGGHPSLSRPVSPNPPTAAFMVPKTATLPGSEALNDVLADYQQSLPGERKSISRNSMQRNSIQSQPQQGHVPSSSQAPITIPASNSNLVHGQNLQRPVSGQAGIGAHGGSRSNSPQPPASRGPSPAPNLARASLISPPTQSIVRAPSPNSIGISLDPNGRVLHDELAQGYQQHQQALRQHQRPLQPQQQQPSYNPPMVPLQQQPMRRVSYITSPSPTIAPPIQPPLQPVTPPPPANVYHQQALPVTQPLYSAPPPAAHPSYAPPSQHLYQQQQPPPSQVQPVQPPPIQQQQHAPHYQPVAQQGPGNAYGGAPQRPTSTGYYAPPQPQPQQPPPQQQQPYGGQLQPQQGQGYQQQQQWNTTPAPLAARRSPSPQPPPPQAGGPTTEDGTPIQFYVKALYDYGATIDEEFDFQAGDIIAVTSTPEDGWWTGELLDEARRQRGRNVFPSNFVCLF